MANTIQPVRGPDYANLILQGLGAFRQVKGIQREGKEFTQGQADRQAKADAARALAARGAKVEGLGLTAQADPQALRELQALDPDRAKAIREAQEFEARRFEKERAETAARIEGQPLEGQIQVLDRRLEMLTQRGSDPRNTQGLRDMLASGDPNLIAQGQEAIRNARVMGERQGFLEPTQVAKTPQGTTLVRNLISAGFKPGTPEFQEALTSAMNRPTTSISLGGGQEEQKELGKLRARSLQTIRDQGEVAQTNLASLDILDSVDVSTGKAEPMKQAIAAWGQSLGVNTSSLANVAAGEAFTAEASKVVLNAMAAQKGPQTESDMKQIRTTVSGLGKTPLANKFINNSARALSKRAIERRDFYDNYLAENESLKGASKAWNEFKRDVPMISKNLKTPEGLPVFYFEFETKVQEANPGATRGEILEAWKANDKKRGK